VGEEVEQQEVDFVGCLKLHPVASVADPFISERARHVLLRSGHLSLREGNVTTAPHAPSVAALGVMQAILASGLSWPPYLWALITWITS
jgi:hypothetical protein